MIQRHNHPVLARARVEGRHAAYNYCASKRMGVDVQKPSPPYPLGTHSREHWQQEFDAVVEKHLVGQ